MAPSAGLRAVVADDAPEFRELVASLLRQEFFSVVEACDGVEAVRAARAHQPDLVVLDISMPNLDGIEACRQIRGFSDAYVLMLTSREEEVDLLIGLAVGADGYMTKPFSTRELVARVKAMLRRRPALSATADVDSPVSDAALRRYGALTIDTLARTASLNATEVALTRTEFDLLDALSSDPRRTFTRSMLLQRVWGDDYFGDDHVVDVQMANLRRKLQDDARNPRFIRTQRGVGYRMASGPDDPPA